MIVFDIGRDWERRNGVVIKPHAIFHPLGLRGHDQNLLCLKMGSHWGQMTRKPDIFVDIRFRREILVEIIRCQNMANDAHA